MDWKRCAALVLVVVLGACASSECADDGSQLEAARAGSDRAAPGRATNTWPWPHESSDLPPDPRLTFGALANGLNYVWMPGKVSDERCSLRLIVHVGSSGEADDERGMAHFVEHMAFNGTARFAGPSIVEWFQRHGMAFGADVNAWTGLYATTYQIDLPQADEASVLEALRILRDFASAVSFEPAEVAAERGVIDAEDRERNSALTAAWHRADALVDPDARRVVRRPIGIAAERARFDAARLQAFHRKWYRPDNMTLVFVGRDAARDPRALFTDVLGELESPLGACPRIEPEVAPPLDGKCAHVFEAATSRVAFRVRWVRPAGGKPRDLAALHDQAALAIACTIGDQLLNGYSRIPKSPLHSIRASAVHATARDADPYEGIEISFVCDADDWASALTWAACGVVDLFELAFTPERFESARRQELGDAEALAADEARAGISERATALARELEAGEVTTGCAVRCALLRDHMFGLDAAACREALARVCSEEPSIVCVGNLSLPDAFPPDFVSMWRAAARERAGSTRGEASRTEPTWSVDAWGSSNIEAPALSAPTSAGFQHATLTNGVRVLLRPSDAVRDEVLAVVCVGTGTRGLDERQRTAVMAVSGALDEFGLARCSAGQVRRSKNGRRASIQSGVSAGAFVLSGVTNRADLHFQLQLLAAHVGEPGWREEGIDANRHRFAGLDRSRERSLNRGRNEMRRELSGKPPPNIPTEAEYLDFTAPQLRELLDPMFHAGPVTVVLAGDFDPTTALASVAQTFGVLPQRDARSSSAVTVPALGIPAKLRREFDVEAGVDKSRVFVMYPIRVDSLVDAVPPVTFLAGIASDRMRVALRERLGRIYAPSLEVQMLDDNPNVGVLELECETELGQEQEVLEACIAVFAEMRIDDDEFERTRKPLLVHAAEGERKNEYWTSLMSLVHEDASVLSAIGELTSRMESVRASDVEAFARQWLTPERASTLIVRSKTNR
jgi:zinc protease